ncbi:MAG: DUF2029 domain-containing protein [Paracoccaceae bacterium]|nr:DUF2029 domain-containing protein [Paracoccaceae bacterium]
MPTSPQPAPRNAAAGFILGWGLLPRERRQVPLISVIAAGLLALCLIYSWQRFLWFFHDELHRGAAYSDLNDFLLVGRMALSGKLAQAYSLSAMHLAQVADGYTGTFLPWVYPPPYDLIVAGLARLGPPLAFAVFVVVPFLGTLWLIRRIAGPRFSEVVICLFPGFYICLACGQNGFVTAGLLGAFGVASLSGSAAAGVPFGLLIIKPHLGLLVGLQCLMTRRWRTLGVALAVAGGASLAATLAFGLPVWLWFLHAAHGASAALAEGRYTLHYMISPYATLRAAGVPAELSLALQGALALFAIAMTWRLARGAGDPRIAQGLILALSLFVTPYALDYDTPILAVAAAFLAGPILERANRWQLAAIPALCWIISGSVLFNWVTSPTRLGLGTTGTQPVSFAGLAYVMLVALILWVLREALVAPGQPALNCTTDQGFAFWKGSRSFRQSPCQTLANQLGRTGSDATTRTASSTSASEKFNG